VFSSSIVTLVHDVEAVNNFEAAGKSNSTVADNQINCDYIASVLFSLPPTHETHLSFSYSTVPNEPAGVFWAVLNRLLIIFQVVLLILSEIGWPLSFFNRFFPVLGSDFGLGALGIMQCLYVCLPFSTVIMHPLTRSRHIDSARLSSRTTSTTFHSSPHFSYFLLAASTSFWDSSSGKMRRPREA
jgi:hypothetical protein